MTRKSSLIWILLLLICNVLKETTASESRNVEMTINDSDNDNEITFLDDENSQRDINERSDDDQDIEDDDGDDDDGEDIIEYDGTDGYVEGIEYDDGDDDDDGDYTEYDDGTDGSNYSDAFDRMGDGEEEVNEDPETIVTNIINGRFKKLSTGTLLNLSPKHVSDVLKDPVGARLAAARPSEIFVEENSEILVIDLIHDNFFLNLDLFSKEIRTNIIYQVPANFVAKTVLVQASKGKFDMSGFIHKFEEYHQELQSELPKIFCLPHFFDFPMMHNPEYYMGRGLTYESGLSKADQMIWDISLQLSLYIFLHDDNFKKSDNYFAVLKVIKEEIKSSRGELNNDIDFNMNYFGLEDFEYSDYLDAIGVNISEVFGCEKLLTLKERSIGINQLGESLGLSDFWDLDYSSLRVEQRIIYRLIIYLAIFNPSLIPETDLRNNLIINFFNKVPRNDFTVAEFEFFAFACISNRLGDVIVGIILSARTSEFKSLIESHMSTSPIYYNFVVESITNELDKLLFMKAGTVAFREEISLESECFYYNKRLHQLSLQQQEQEGISSLTIDASTSGTKRQRLIVNDEVLPENHLKSHFLTNERLRLLLLQTPQNRSFGLTTFMVPYPDKEYFIARYDNLMQNLESADFGQIGWDNMLKELKPEIRKVYDQHEKDLDEFVRLTFQAIDYMRTHPSAGVSISFRGSPSVGKGLKIEAFEVFSRAILLPQFKVFTYNSAIRGFIPYPLLHQDIMATLGYLNQWFLDNNLPLSWNLSEDYIKFLFYEENPLEEMQTIVEHFYKPIFKNIEALKTPGINPLDYFPTIFHTHWPLASSSHNVNQTSPFDLFNPTDSLKNHHGALSKQDIELLSQYIEPLKSTFEVNFEESKEEKGELIESKEDFESEMVIQNTSDDENLYFAQLKLKLDTIKFMKDTVSKKIIKRLLLGRFAFMKQFLKYFNTSAQDHVTAKFYIQLQKAQVKDITAEELIAGLNFSNERLEIIVRDKNGNWYTPRQALEHILKSLPQEMMKTFYWFCTGSWSLPIGGLKSYPIGVIVSRVNQLPSARTCFRSLNFNLNPDPKFTLEKHLEAMRTVLLESSGFHVDEGVTNTGDNVGTFVDVHSTEEMEMTAGFPDAGTSESNGNQEISHDRPEEVTYIPN